MTKPLVTFTVLRNTVTAPLCIGEYDGGGTYWSSELEGDVRVTFVIAPHAEEEDWEEEGIGWELEEFLSDLQQQEDSGFDQAGEVTIDSWIISVDMEDQTAIAIPDGVDVDTRDLPRPIPGDRS